MEIELYAILLIIAIIVAILIILAKPFKKKEEEEQEDSEQKTLEDFPAVSKSWVEPMSENHKELLARKENDLNYETSAEKADSFNDENSYVASKIDNEENFTIEENYYEEDFSAEKNNDQTATAKNLSKNKGLKKIAMNRNMNIKKSDVAEINMENNVYELAVKDSIIFTHNNEDYSSYVLDIKHGNVKVKYRSQEKWISFSQIKKIL